MFSLVFSVSGHAQFSHQVLIQTGDRSPDLNGKARSFDPISIPVLNNEGQVVFIGNLAQDEFSSPEWAIITGGSVPLQVVVRSLDPAPDGNGSFSYPIGNPTINDSGVIAFKSEFESTVGGGEQRVLLYNGTMTEVASTGQAAAGGNGTYSGFVHSLWTAALTPINMTGHVTFRGSISGSAQGSLDDAGIYRAQSGSITEIAREGTSYPGLGSLGLVNDSVINNSGDVLFQAWFTSGYGFYLSDGSTVTKVAHPGDSSPDGTGSIGESAAAQATLNNAGMAITLMGMSGSGVSPDQALILHDGVSSSVVARAGEPDPAGNIWRSFGGSFVGASPVPPAMNDGGDIAFSGVTSPTRFGTKISRIYAGKPGALQLVVSGGDPAPDGNGTFPNSFGFGVPLINENGDVVFTANVENTTGGEENQGLFFWEASTGSLKQVIRQGDAFAGDRLLKAQISPWPQAGGNASSINNLGQIAFQFSLFNGDSGVAITSPAGKPTIKISSITASNGNATVSWLVNPSDWLVDVYTSNDMENWSILAGGISDGFLTESLPSSDNLFYLVHLNGMAFPAPLHHDYFEPSDYPIGRFSWDVNPYGYEFTTTDWFIADHSGQAGSGVPIAPGAPEVMDKILVFAGTDGRIGLVNDGHLYSKTTFSLTMGVPALDDDIVLIWFRSGPMINVQSPEGYFLFLAGSGQANPHFYTGGARVGLGYGYSNGLHTILLSDLDTPELAEWLAVHGMRNGQAEHWRIVFELEDENVKVYLSDRGDTNTVAPFVPSVPQIDFNLPGYKYSDLSFFGHYAVEGISQTFWVDEIEFIAY